MSFYDDAAADALELLLEFGYAVTLTRKSGDSVHPITGVVAAGTDASVTTTGFDKPYKDGLIDGTRILSSDRELILSNEQKPLPSDKPVIDGQNWSIVNIKTIAGAGDAVIYKCQVRR